MNTRHSNRRHTRAAFTIIEILVVIGMTGILLSLLLPAVQKSREAARSLECSNRMRQNGIAAQQFYDTNGRYPDVFSDIPWTVHFLPYLEKRNLQESILDAFRANDVTTMATLGSNLVSEFVCPQSAGDQYSQAGLAFGSYALNFEVCISKEGGFCSDGKSNTMLATEMERHREPWSEGPVRSIEPFDSSHNGISHVLLCDGSVRAVSNKTDVSVLHALETPNGGEVPGDF